MSAHYDDRPSRITLIQRFFEINISFNIFHLIAKIVKYFWHDKRKQDITVRRLYVMSSQIKSNYSNARKSNALFKY